MEKVKKTQNPDEINRILVKKLEKGVSEISCSKYSQALETLKKCETQLEKLINQGIPIDQDIILPTLHNIALCYQSIADFHNCAAYIEACIFNVKRRTELSVAHMSTIAERIRKVKYLCLLYLQLADCLSKLNQHRAAVEHSRQSFRQCALIIKLSLTAFTEAKQKKNSSNTSKKSNQILDYYTNSIDILQLLYLQMTGKKSKKSSKEVTMRSVLGVQKTSEWVYSLTYEKIIEIKPLHIQHLKSSHNIRAELSKDFMLDKICLTAASCLLQSRELLLINEDFDKAKSYFNRAVVISSTFFPNSCLFLQNIVQEYIDKFGKVESKKFKSPRSTSAKNAYENERVFKNQKANRKNEQKNEWKVKSERKSENIEGMMKGNHSQSESMIGKSLGKIQEFMEKCEPEPQLSGASEQEDIIKNLIMCSNGFYEQYTEEEVDKYEYMPLKREL
ncbi:hypothetical protein SteCoe_34912 [Stentor coeruleus]|uniref:Uncharacterized protein n=1 Tax=Stentor coeruleus TaxID=5963 RepID=A0A1R2ATH9_9CILI|nr:hypothetical protein SteCoe_34912 [Stentor coeruleus]